MIKYLRYPIKNNDLNSFTDYFSKIDVQYVFSFIKNMGGINPHVDAQKIFKFDALFSRWNKRYRIWHNLLAFKNSKSFKHSYQKNEVQDFKLNSKKILKTEFIPNCLYGFLRNDFSWHSVEPIDVSDNYIRKSININFIYKN